MAYKTHPYVSFTLFALPNPFRSYEVNENEVRLNKIFGSEAARTQNVSTKVQGLLKGLGKGSLTIYENGQLRFTFTNVSDVKRLEEEIRKAQNPSSSSEVSQQKILPWHEGLSDADLQDHAIIIPELPGSFTRLIWEITADTGSGTDHGIINKWAQQGERVMASIPDVVVAPTSGQFHGSRHMFDQLSLEEFQKQHRLSNNDLLCFFIPLKGSFVTCTSSDVRNMPDGLKIVERYLGDKNLPGRLKGNELFRKELIKDYSEFNNAKLKRVSVSELPILHPNLEPQYFARYDSPSGMD